MTSFISVPDVAGVTLMQGLYAPRDWSRSLLYVCNCRHTTPKRAIHTAATVGTCKQLQTNLECLIQATAYVSAASLRALFPQALL